MNEQYMFPQYQPMGYRMQQPQPQTGSGLIWVTGIEGAKSYLVAPNTTVMLMDSEGQRFYIKSSDQSGMPMPIRIFDYQEQTASTGDKMSQVETYVTRKEFEELEKRIAKLGGNDDE